MNPAELGRRIKEARIQKKMTQSELVGDFITRNMLSRIESGNATPSVKTLEYIASKLDLPVSSLVPDSGGQPQDMLTEAKTALGCSEYEQAIEKIKYCETLFFDEYAAISSIAYFNLANKYEKQGDFNSAYKAYKKACELAGEGIYANKERKSDAALGMVRVTQKQGEDFM